MVTVYFNSEIRDIVKLSFLEVVSNESDMKFKEPTKEFLTKVSLYSHPGYEDYSCNLYTVGKEETAKRDKSGKYSLFSVANM